MKLQSDGRNEFIGKKAPVLLKALELLLRLYSRKRGDFAAAHYAPAPVYDVKKPGKFLRMAYGASGKSKAPGFFLAGGNRGCIIKP